MARKKKQAEGGGGGAPAWMATFSDLMNLLLCFFVLLFASSTVDAEKYELIVASLQSSFSILPSGGSNIVDQGELVGMGISQLAGVDLVYTAMLNAGGTTQEEVDKDADFIEKFEQEGMNQSEKMADEISKKLNEAGIQNEVKVDFNAQYVKLTLNGAILFEPLSATIRPELKPTLDKIGGILQGYKKNAIEVEGHTDPSPDDPNGQYVTDEELSSYRAMNVAVYIRDKYELDPAKVKFSGRACYVPIDTSGTADGRAQNRRVEIKIYNDLNSAE